MSPHGLRESRKHPGETFPWIEPSNAFDGENGMLSGASLQTPPRIWENSLQTHIKGGPNVSKTVRFVTILAVLMSLVLAAPAFADSYKRSLTLDSPAKLGGTEIKPGEYRIEFDGTKVVVKDGKKVLAEAPAEWVETKNEVQGDTVVIDGGVITEIRIEGRKRVIKIH
jgi:hypothetical protein